MQVIQGLCVALPGGEFVAEEYICTGIASLEAKESISGAGGMYDWFFVPDGLVHTITEFQTREEQDSYVALNMYPITHKIGDFLRRNL
jgi:hypothetical protein